ncbi:DNA repair protein rad52, variant 2 [Pleurotus ostreatus]|nr:DNA repair protein rad52, variant 2 [Pleurotus ostreatus]
MPVSLSAHLVDSFYQSARPPQSHLPFHQFVDNSLVGQPRHSSQPGNDNIITFGRASFNASMHGRSEMDQSMSFNTSSVSSSYYGMDALSMINDPTPSYMDLSQATAAKIATLQAKLNKKLGPEYISQRPGPGGGPKLTYAEGWKIINLANEVFGFNGWSSNIVSLTTDYIDTHEEGRRHNVGVTAIVRVTLRDGVFHEDVGYGVIENAKSKGAALDKCKKEAVTDAIKRALRNFGNLLGNCLYDKAYTQEIVKIKVPPPKFDKSDLHRRPEFEETKPDIRQLEAGLSTSGIASTSHAPQQACSSSSSSMNRPSTNPANLQRTSAAVATTSTSTPVADIKGKGRAVPGANIGLNTPVTTPANPAGRPNANRGTMPPPPAFGKAFNSSVSNGSVQRLPEPRATGSASTGINQPKMPPRPPSALSRGPNVEPVSVEPRVSHNIDPGLPEEAEIDPDESFGFLSDDDAFLAAVDLGEGDLGRPIDPDEGLGGPALSANSVQSESEILDTNRHVSEQAQHVRFQEASHQERGTLSGATRPSVRTESGVGQRATVGAEQFRAATPGSSANSHQLRSGTPSMGGFHFPAGVNPTQENPQLPARNGQRLTLGSGILGLNKDQFSHLFISCF